MSIRRITVQYIGNTLFIPKLERDAVYIITDDGRTFVDIDRHKDYMIDACEALSSLANEIDLQSILHLSQREYIAALVDTIRKGVGDLERILDHVYGR